MAKKKKKLKWKNIIVALLVLIAAMVLIITLINFIFPIRDKNEALESSVAVSIYSDIDLKNEKSDYNILIDEDNLPTGEEYEALSKYGVTISDTEESLITIDHRDELKDYELSEDKTHLTINTLQSDEIFFRYDIIVAPDLTITGIMVTPYKQSGEKLTPVSDIVLDTGDYEEQTKIYNELKDNISNLTYIPVTPYSDIQTVEEMGLTTVVNKNSCLSSDVEPKSPAIPAVKESARTGSDVHTVDESIIKPVEELFVGLAEVGVDVVLTSGYRDYATQESLYNSYVSTDGEAAADMYSARPGCSEHQTGMSLDISLESQQHEDVEALNETEEAQVIYDTAPKYGFVVRYPEGKEYMTQYDYESWHLRYVGVDAATIIHDEDITLDQYAASEEFYNAKYMK